MTAGLAAPELQVAAVHPMWRLEREDERLQHMARLAMLGQSGGKTMGWRKEEKQTEA